MGLRQVARSLFVSPLSEATSFAREAADSPVPSLRSGLSSILGARDAGTGALARSDDQVMQTLRQLQAELRMALGYPAPSARRPESNRAASTRFGKEQRDGRGAKNLGKKEMPFRRLHNLTCQHVTITHVPS